MHQNYTASKVVGSQSMLSVHPHSMRSNTKPKLDLVLGYTNDSNQTTGWKLKGHCAPTNQYQISSNKEHPRTIVHMCILQQNLPGAAGAELVLKNK